MALTSEHFARTLAGLQQLKPFAKPLGEEGLMLAWLSFPEQAKAELDANSWSFAAAQFLLDPNPPKEVPVHIALLRYVYRIRDGSPALDWGLKTDLASRLRLPTHFHPPIPTSEADLIARGQRPGLDGPRYSPHGVLAGGAS